MEEKWLIFFDGACHLCSREIEVYRKARGSEKLSFVDISEAQFSATHYGLDPIRVNQEMHVKSPDGHIHVAMDAFIEIWKVLPGYHLISKVAGKREFRPILDLGYAVFAKIRPYLPKRKTTCVACENRTQVK